MNLIVAVDQNYGIGSGNELLYYIPEDLKFFKFKTLNKVIVMGSKTFLSLPDSAPLKNRTNIILTQNENLNAKGAIVANSIPALAEVLKSYNSDDIFVIGGASVYTELLPFVKTAYVTKIEATRPAESFFPDIEKEESWKLLDSSKKYVSSGISFSFLAFENIAVKSLNDIKKPLNTKSKVPEPQCRQA